MRKVLFLFILCCITTIYAQDKLKIGVLSYGTVNWELDVLKHHKLDKKYGFDLELVNVASKNAQSVALLSGDVDMIVHDWVWVNLQSHKNKSFMFYPYSKATGTLVINKNSNIKSLADLKGKQLGIAGGKFSKTWLLFKAYYEKKYNRNFQDDVSVVYASPSILYLKMLENSLDASINFWHFNSKLESKGVKPLISIKEVFNYLGAKGQIPFIGWTFSKEFGQKNPNLINSFIKASIEAKEILLSNNEEWNRVKPLMNAKNDEVFESLKEGYKKGVIKDFSQENIEDIKKIYKVLAKQSEFKYIDENSTLNEDIFWKN
jgi:NitT/TauT family transport system substrate-binding protein